MQINHSPVAALVTLILACQTAAASQWERALQRIQKGKELPGLSVLIRTPAGKEHHYVKGLRSLSSSSSLEKSDSFHLGSNAKAMTAALAGRLVERKQLSWNAKVGDFFPKAKLHFEVTLTQLLSHTGGIVRDAPKELAANPDYYPSSARQEFAEALLKLRPKGSVDVYHYSNAGYIIAGAMLEKASGKSWEILIREEVFAPLKMLGCDFGSQSREPNSIIGHHDDSGKLIPVPGGMRADNPPVFGPAGTVRCPMKEWLKFAKAFLTETSVTNGFLKQSNMKRLVTPVGNNNYALGWGVFRPQWVSESVLRHNGSNVYNWATIVIAPKTGAIILAVTNRGGDKAKAGVNEAIEATIQHFLIKRLEPH